LFLNLTVSPSIIQQELFKGDFSKYIPPIQQILSNCNSTLWVTNEKLNDGLKQLLPSWMVTNYPLRFLNKDYGKRIGQAELIIISHWTY